MSFHISSQWEAHIVSSSEPEPPVPNRVELIPVVWYDQVRSSSSALMRSLKASTLNTIPALREIANDVIFDVLMYMTPNFCSDVLECVTQQITASMELFRKLNPDFQANGGVCSLAGHSLGSVICWDLLTLLKEKEDNRKMDRLNRLRSHGVQISNDGHSADVGYTQYASGEGANNAKNGSWGPSLAQPLKQTLPFVPEFTLFLGSPVGLFLTLRGAHPVFDELREQFPNKPKAAPFTLPTGSIHNIFHPSDPVAYRIEPLLLAQETENLPPPVYLTREGQDVRLHVKAMQLGDEIRKSIAEKKHTISNFMTSLTEQAANMLQQMDDRSNKVRETQGDAVAGGSDPLRFPLAGRNGRLDLQLQPRVIENEYVSAVMAHSSYMLNTDVTDYLIDLTKAKEVIDLTDCVEMADLMSATVAA